MTAPAPLATIAALLDVHGLPSDGAAAERSPSGLIQQTWIVRLSDGRRLVAQRMHRAFGPPVLLDIEAVTAHLASRGLATPRLLRTTAGELGARDADGELWRLLSWLPGRTVDRVDSPARAEAAAGLVARFHLALADFDRPFSNVRPGAHDTAAHLRKLDAALASDRDFAERPRVAPLAAEIVAAGLALPSLPKVAPRVAHGDLKISNVLFDDDGAAHALIDLDTMGLLTIAYELGDAWRSWCNPLGEDVEATRFDLDVFGAAVAGYARAAGGLLGADEVASLVPGVITVATELAARFCADAFVDAEADSYFGWDPARFASRREHNRVRAAGQLALARAVTAERVAAERLVARAFL